MSNKLVGKVSINFTQHIETSHEDYRSYSWTGYNQV